MSAVIKDPPKKPFYLGIIGDPSKKYNIIEINRFDNLFDSAIDSTNNVVVVSKFTNRGTNKLAYDWAWKRNLKIAGIAATPDCWTYPCRLVNYIKLISGTPGSENRYFANFCNALIVVEANNDSMEIMNIMKAMKKQIVDFSYGKT